MKLEIGRRYVAVCGVIRVMLFTPKTRKDINFYEKMRQRISVVFEPAI
jgi:hypothetical protein